MNKNKDNSLNNTSFLFQLPMLFALILIIPFFFNFFIDSLVLLVVMYCFHIDNKKMFYMQHILTIFIFNLLSFLIGAIFVFISLILGFYAGNELWTTIIAVFISSICLYLFDYFIVFRECKKDMGCKISLIFATVTAPYIFFIPFLFLY